MEASEANSIILRLMHLRENLEELDKKFGQLVVKAQGSRLVAADSSTPCTRPSPKSGEMTILKSQKVQTLADSSQSSTSGFREGEINLRTMTGTSK
ncbi:UNVERIFIED_CONTAM: hypothetical protein Sindi_1710100, partial [Sesamum indicum]